MPYNNYYRLRLIVIDPTTTTTHHAPPPSAKWGMNGRRDGLPRLRHQRKTWGMNGRRDGLPRLQLQRKTSLTAEVFILLTTQCRSTAVERTCTTHALLARYNDFTMAEPPLSSSCRTKWLRARNAYSVWGACLPAFLPASQPACLLTSLLACLPARLLARLPACLPACRPAWLRKVVLIFSPAIRGTNDG